MDIPNYRNLLRPQQQTILDECIKKKSGGLSLPMGSGKTILSLVLGLEQRQDQGSRTPILVVMSKTLLSVWIEEIGKFFDKKYPITYEIFHKDYIKKPATIATHHIDRNVDIVLTTIDILSDFYRNGSFLDKFSTLEYDEVKNTMVRNYNISNKPIGRDDNLYSITWSCLIVDEGQTYNNIETDRCRALVALCARHRWCLSGTIVNEPKIGRILGYYMIIGDRSFPNNMRDAKKYIRSRNYPGLKASMVHRGSKDMILKLPKTNRVLIEHTLTPDEEIVYASLRKVTNNLAKRLHKLVTEGNAREANQFRCFIMVAVIYLRQCLICPLIPFARITINMMDMKNKSLLSSLMFQELTTLNIEKYINNPHSIKSSRINKILEVIDRHPEEKLVIFTSFRSGLDLIKHHIDNTERPTFTILSSMAIDTRSKEISKFRNSNSGILLLTYSIGSEGLNLQCAGSILLVDFWWNDGKTQQAISRILRSGQIADTVNIYYFLSNTGIERAIFHKHDDKLEIIDKLMDGSLDDKKVRPASILEIVKIMDLADNARIIKSVIDKNKDK